MKSQSAPAAPDPTATANAQAAMNKETALAQARLNNTNQVTPYGNLTYTAGEEVNGVPQYTATQTLSPEQQQLYDLNTQTQKNIGQIGVDQSARIGDLLGQPVNLDNAATESRLMELGRSRLDPLLSQRRTSREQDLINRGIRPGTQAYDNAMRSVTEGENDAYNQLLLSGRGQAVQEALAQRNQPINEISALLSGSQVSQPNFVGSPQTQIAGSDIIGPTYANYQGQMNQYNQGRSSNNSTMGGLFGLGGSALGGWAQSGFSMSDARMKENIRPIGKLDSGLTVYAYNFKGKPTTEIGVLAQEVERSIPDAVKEFGGIKYVNYGRL